MQNGALVVVTLLVLGNMSYFFVAQWLFNKANDVLFTDFNKAYGFHFIAVCYLDCVLLALWALIMTYRVGPGYATDHFKSEKIEFLKLAIGAPSGDEDEPLENQLDCGLERAHSAEAGQAQSNCSSQDGVSV